MARSLSIKSSVKLRSGYDLPVLGFGVYKTPQADTATAVSKALKDGYRHVDCAIMYANEAGCAAGMNDSGIPRDQIFFTSKVSPAAIEGGYETAKQCVADSLQKTGFEYVDLFLLHSPSGTLESRNGAWRALVEAQRSGKVRSIGISNYGMHHLQELEQYITSLEKQDQGSGGVISVAQYELHPWCGRKEIVSWCTARGIAMEAYCPIVRGRRFDEPGVQALAKKYSRTPAQILVRWSLQKGFVPLPKSATPSRIAENADVFDFELSDEEVAQLETDDYSPCAWDPTVWQDK